MAPGDALPGPSSLSAAANCVISLGMFGVEAVNPRPAGTQ